MNFNTEPYYDDNNIEKNHLKVLFKPNYYVQARELNVLQSILQNQISSVGNHLFKNNAKITGCSSAFVQYDYVRLNDTYDGVQLSLSQYDGLKVVGAVSSVEATIVYVTEINVDDPATIYVVYTKTGSDNEQTTFIAGEDVKFYDKNDVLVYTATVRCPSCPENVGSDLTNPMGKSMFFTIEDGIFYHNGYFIKNSTQLIITEKYLNRTAQGQIQSDLTYRVGLDVIESIATVDDDDSLYDPHQNSPNYAAEGADRYKIDLRLSIRSYVEDVDNSDFITLAKVRQNHTVEYKKDDTEYADIMEEIARRTYETSGNFTHVPWKARFLNEKKTNLEDSLGWSMTGKDENFTTLVGVGVGYVKGKRVANVSETVVTGRKARDTKKLRGASASFNPIQNFVISTTHDISWINHNGTSLLTDQIVNFLDSSGASIGSFKIYDVERLPNNQYRLYVYDINLSSGKSLNMVTGVKTTDLSIRGDVTEMKLDNSSNTTLLYSVGYNTIKSLRSNENQINGNTNINLKRRFSGVLDGSGSITFTTQTNEFIVDPASSNPICWVGNNPNGVNVILDSTKYVYSNSALTINLGVENAGKNISFVTAILRTSQQEKTKTLTRHVYTTNSKPTDDNGSILKLNHADGYKLQSVQYFNTSDPSNLIDITSEYVFDDGQRDMFYEIASIKRNVDRSFNVDDRLIVTYYYFEHSGSQGYFTVDSYNQLMNDVEFNLEYSDIPTYKSNGVEIRLSEVYDFRTIKRVDGELDQNTPIVQFNTNVSFDIEFYLPRSDLLLVSSNGAFYYKEGVSSETPSVPKADPDSMPIYEVYISAYTYTINDIKVKFIDNRKFTMKDISKIEKRVSNVENAIALSMLEMQTVNMSIKDVNGLDRYKNGFLVDNFKNFYGSDITNIEYKASLDRSSGQLRPEFKSSNIHLALDELKSENLVYFGNIAMAKFEHDLFISNPFVTKTLSINPYMVYRTMGSMSLSPNIDTWADSTNAPTIVANIDSGVDALREVANAAQVTGIDYGTWIDFNQSITTSSETTVDESDTQRVTTTNTTTTTTTDSTRNVQTTSIGSRTQSYTIDDIVKDVSIIPYIRSRTIQFYATNLKANTKMYAFFDGVDVTEHCKKTQQLSSNDDVLVNRAQAVFGASPMITDADGNLTGEFRIPENKFFTGEKKFVLTNDPTNSGNADVETTRAESTYFAGGVSTVKQDVVMNVITPTFNVSNASENRSTTSVSRETNTEVVEFPAPSVNTSPEIPPQPTTTPAGQWSWLWHWVWNGRQWEWDPVAQGFKVPESCFISKIDVYFASVDVNNDLIWFEIRELVNGYPSNTAIARKEVSASVLKDYVSEDGTKAYSVIFPTPTFVDSSKAYAFVVGGYSPETRLYVSTLGDKLLNSDRYLEQPPLTYTMYRSLNGDTWTAYQYDTMKIDIYRCVFNNYDAKFVFKNESNVVDDTFAFTVRCEHNPIEVQVNSNKVRIHAKNHGLKESDYVNINFDNDNYYTLEVISGMPQIDQPISTTTGSGYIKDIKITETLNYYKVSIRDVEGYFLNGQEFTCESRSYEYRDLFLISDTGAYGAPITQNVVTGYVRGVDVVGAPSDIAGSPLSLFSKKHIVRTVDTIDSFIIEIEGTFNTSGRFGGDNVTAFNTNIKYDVFNVAGQYLTYDANTNWVVDAHKYDDMSFISSMNIKPQHDIYVEEPLVVFSSANEKRIFNNSNNSFNLSVYCSLSSPYISPVFNTDSFSLTTVSNRIDSITVNKNSIEPNASTQVIDETHATNGTDKTKHITTKVMLENPASDMKIIFDVYCPNVGDFDVYVKVITAQNNVDESLINWIKVDDYTKKRFSNGITDMIEYNLTLSENCTAWTDDIEYIGYRAKLVSKSTNSSKPVFFQNLRLIAIT